MHPGASDYRTPINAKTAALGATVGILFRRESGKRDSVWRNCGEEALKLLPAVLAASSSKGIISDSRPPTGPTATPLEHRVWYLHLQKY